MDILKELEFTDEEIEKLSIEIPVLILDKIVSQKQIVYANLSYLKNLGVLNYKDLFFKFYEVFMLDHTIFTDIFEKYDKEDLIKYLKDNVDILEFLWKVSETYFLFYIFSKICSIIKKAWKERLKC